VIGAFPAPEESAVYFPVLTQTPKAEFPRFIDTFGPIGLYRLLYAANRFR
jgi:hypothetical protein